MSRLRGRIGHWEIGVAVQALVLGYWLVEPAWGWALAAGGLAVWVAVGAARRRRPAALLAVIAATAAAAAALDASARVHVVERAWPELRSTLLSRGARQLEQTLDESVGLARSLAVTGASVHGDRVPAFGTLADAVAGDGPERGIVVFRDRRPWVWAGRHRLEATPAGPELSVRMTPFYLLLEARRQDVGQVGVARVLLAADSAVPDRAGSVAARFVRRTGVGLQFYALGTVPVGPDVFPYCIPACGAGEGGSPDTLLSVRVVPPGQGAYKLGLLDAGSRWTAVLMVATLALLIMGGDRLGRWTGVAVLAGLLVFTPAGVQIGLGALFSPATYFSAYLGPLSASAGALLAAAVVAVIGLVALARHRLPGRLSGAPLGVPLALAAPVLVSRLAEGITPPATPVGLPLWLSWEVTLAAAGIVLGLATAVLVRGSRAGEVHRGLAWAAGIWALGAALVGMAIWQPGRGWPVWYGLLWWPAAILAVQRAPRLRLIVALAVVAGAGAALLTWSRTVEGRLRLAQRDAERLSGGDPVAIGLLEQFGAALVAQPVPGDAAALYARWRESPLSRDDYPAVLGTWAPDGGRTALLELGELELHPGIVRAVVEAARERRGAVLEDVTLEPGKRYVMAVPFADGSVVTVAAAPRSRLIRPVLAARFLRGERRLVAPYDMSLGEMRPGNERTERIEWQRDGRLVRGFRGLPVPAGARHLHVQVDLGAAGQRVVRGALVVALNAALGALLWLVAEALSGRARLPSGLRDLLALHSYRARLALALAGFFVMPTLGFAVWSAGRLPAELERSGDLIVRQTLSDAAGTAQQFITLTPPNVRERLGDLADRLGADLLWYEEGVLGGASTVVLEELGLLDAYLPPPVYRAVVLGDELEVAVDASIGGQRTRVGYWSLGGPEAFAPVLAAPRLVDVTGIQRDQENLAFGLLLATLVGVAAAVGLAALAARSLARPVHSLRAAALAVGRGERLPSFGEDVPAEFVPVVEAFQRMARDIEASQAALEAARRRTATVLRNVATGVVALDNELRVTIANPQAEALLDRPLPAGTALGGGGETGWAEVWAWVRAVMEHETDADAREFSVGRRRIRAQVAALHTEPRGCVVALDDTTELTRAVRVLAWGELARQIAHEIKNPLTPIRLGVQHVQRARREGSPDFDAVLERTGRQILAEIERLDAIARAFARFGAPPAEAAPLRRQDIVRIAHDVAALYQLADGPAVRVCAVGPTEAMVRQDEVKEVLINLVENARDAGASEITIEVSGGADGAQIAVRDDGHGIAVEHLDRIFEPQFSTTTSGTGLGLAICKRLVESWGGTIAVDSEVGKGTVVVITIGG